MEIQQAENSHHFLQGGGEMGERIRKYDWSKTVLGSPGTWPHSLRTTINILLNSRFPMLIWWGPDLIQFYNDPYRGLLGTEGKHPNALGQKGSECWKEIWPIISPYIENVRNTGEATWMDDQLISFYRNGEIKDSYWTFNYSKVLDDDGGFGGVLAIVMETTEAVEARRRQAQETEARFRSAIEQAPIAIGLTRGKDMVFESINEPMLEIINRQSKAEVLGRTVLDAIPELADQPVYNILQDVYRTGESFKGDEVPATLVKDGMPQSRYFNITYSRIDAGGTLFLLHMAIDVTEQVLARKKIEESEMRFRSLVEEAPVATALFVGRELVVEVANVSMLNIFGKGKSVFGKPLKEALPELQGQSFLEILDDVYTTGKAFSARAAKAEIVVDGKLGTYYFDFTYQPLRDAEGEIFAIIDMAVDVTEQVLSRDKLRDKENALAAALEQLQLSKIAAELGTFDMDPVSGTMHWDNRCRAVFGINHNNPVDFDRDFIERLHPEDQHRVLAVVNRAFIKAQSNGHYDIEYRTIGAEDGIERWVRAKGKVYFDEEDQPSRFIGSVLDITPQVGARQQIEKLVVQRTRELAEANESLVLLNKELNRSNAQLEEFAHVTSHDLKEPVRKIQIFANRLKANVGSNLNVEGMASLTRIEHAANRMGNLIDDLLLFSQISQRPLETEEVDLNRKLQFVLEDLELQIEEKKAHIAVTELPVVRGHKRQLQQLFQNLISNALKYSKANETPKIEVSSSEVTEGGISYNQVVVKDNGIGFEQQYEHQIFQLFSRLHGNSDYSGTGVGLSIVKKVVENHNGIIRVQSEPGKGTRFEILLPS